MLTKEQIKILRKTGRVSFHHTPQSAHIAVTEVTQKRDREGRSVEIEHPDIPVESIVREISRAVIEGKPFAEVAHCFDMKWTDNGGDDAYYWRTIVRLLKIGDVLSLHWGRDFNCNQNMEKADLHGDRLSLHIQRGKTKMVFIIACQVCPDNTARMTRRGPFNNQ